MNNKDFISRLAQRTGYSQVPTQRMVTNVIDAMSDAFQDGDSIAIDGVGISDVKKKMERVMLSPTTQQRMLVPPKLVLAFKPIAAWKERIKKGGDADE